MGIACRAGMDQLALLVKMVRISCSFIHNGIPILATARLMRPSTPDEVDARVRVQSEESLREPTSRRGGRIAQPQGPRGFFDLRDEVFEPEEEPRELDAPSGSSGPQPIEQELPEPPPLPPPGLEPPDEEPPNPLVEALRPRRRLRNKTSARSTPYVVTPIASEVFVA